MLGERILGLAQVREKRLLRGLQLLHLSVILLLRLFLGIPSIHLLCLSLLQDELQHLDHLPPTLTASPPHPRRSLAPACSSRPASSRRFWLHPRSEAGPSLLSTPQHREHWHSAFAFLRCPLDSRGPAGPPRAWP